MTILYLEFILVFFKNINNNYYLNIIIKYKKYYFIDNPFYSEIFNFGVKILGVKTHIFIDKYYNKNINKNLKKYKILKIPF